MGPDKLSSPLPRTCRAGRRNRDNQHLPVPRFGAPWLLHLRIQRVHQMPFPGALGSGIESQAAFIG